MRTREESLGSTPQQAGDYCKMWCGGVLRSIKPPPQSDPEYFKILDERNKIFGVRLGILRFGVIPKKLGHSKCGIWIADSGIFNLLSARPSRSVEGGRGL